jgi:hypothetical protein
MMVMAVVWMWAPGMAWANHGRVVEFEEFEAGISGSGMVEVEFRVGNEAWAILHDRGVAPTLVVYGESEVDGEVYFADSVQVSVQEGTWRLSEQVRPFDAEAMYVELVGFDGTWRVAGLDVGEAEGACVELERDRMTYEADEADREDCVVTADGMMPSDGEDDRDRYVGGGDGEEGHGHEGDRHDEQGREGDRDRHGDDGHHHDGDDEARHGDDRGQHESGGDDEGEPTGAQKAAAIRACNETGATRSVTKSCLDAIGEMSPVWAAEAVRACDEHTGTYSNQQTCLGYASEYDVSPVEAVRACDEVTGTYSDNMKCIEYGADYEGNPAAIIRACDEVSATYADQVMCFRMGRSLPVEGGAELVESCADGRDLEACLEAAGR